MFDSPKADSEEARSIFDTCRCGASMSLISNQPHPRYEAMEFTVYRCQQCGHEMRILKPRN